MTDASLPGGRLALLVEQSGDGIIVTDADGVRKKTVGVPALRGREHHLVKPLHVTRLVALLEQIDAARKRAT
jgi:hypothetical protein